MKIKNYSRVFVFGMILKILFAPVPVFAAGIGGIGLLDPADLLSLQSLFPQDVADAIIKTAGAYTAHRPYQGATSIATYNSVDVFLEVTMMKIGETLPKALTAAGFDASSATAIPAIPVAQLHLRKAFGPSFDAGFSIFSYKGQTIYGGDVKIVLYDPEEGPSFALRMGYTYLNLPILYTKAQTFIPEFVMGRKLYFAEPYLGAGLRYSLGEVTMSLPLPAPLDPVTIKKSGSGLDEYLFTGILFRIFGPQGLRLGMEGSYSFAGFHTMGLSLGMGF